MNLGVMRFVQHRTLGLGNGDSPGTCLHTMAFQATEIKLIVKKVPGQLEVSRGADSEMAAAVRLCGPSPQNNKV